MVRGATVSANESSLQGTLSAMPPSAVPPIVSGAAGNEPVVGLETLDDPQCEMLTNTLGDLRLEMTRKV
jgi:hypothetical protein